MSWKSIEMQVALPRTQDAGKIQEHMTKQQQQFQDTIAQNQLKETEIKRTQVNEFEKIRDAKIRREDPQHEDKNFNDEENQKQDRENHEEKQGLQHPYLGKKIDVSR
ncbi:hypothetical protein ACFFIS_11290 [Virgibacillus soli]|uniref:RNA polymerase subunit sigma n=1 Tax=Paracerasibacillus soli TaxID=480284 RepID=A0ABU5CPA2_9BACI|nr:hypothetical protein [Virgibacillus soli]MDY0408184.1 hypothetical protein [Virgibacillus soli]